MDSGIFRLINKESQKVSGLMIVYVDDVLALGSIQAVKAMQAKVATVWSTKQQGILEQGPGPGGVAELIFLSVRTTRGTSNLDGTPSNPGWDLDGPRDRTQARVWMAPPETVTDFQAFHFREAKKNNKHKQLLGIVPGMSEKLSEFDFQIRLSNLRQFRAPFL